MSPRLISGLEISAGCVVVLHSPHPRPFCASHRRREPFAAPLQPASTRQQQGPRAGAAGAPFPPGWECSHHLRARAGAFPSRSDEFPSSHPELSQLIKRPSKARHLFLFGLEHALIMSCLPLLTVIKRSDQLPRAGVARTTAPKARQADDLIWVQRRGCGRCCRS